MKLKVLVLLALNFLQTNCTLFSMLYLDQKDGNPVFQRARIQRDSAPNYGTYKTIIEGMGKNPLKSTKYPDDMLATEIVFSDGGAGSIALVEIVNE